MLKLAIVCFIFIAPTFMGMAITALLTVEQFTTDYGLIAWVAFAAGVAAMPFSWFVAKRTEKLTADVRS